MLRHAEPHFTHRIGWLRAGALGANEGIVSTASLIVGVAAAEASRNRVLVAGGAGLVAGAMSMTAGESVSVSSQSDPAGKHEPKNNLNPNLHRQRNAPSLMPEAARR